VLRPAMRLRHIRKDAGFIWRRIKATTPDSFKPNCNSMASKEVRSSQAISMMRERSAGDFGASTAGMDWRGAALNSTTTMKSFVVHTISVFLQGIVKAFARPVASNDVQHGHGINAAYPPTVKTQINRAYSKLNIGSSDAAVQRRRHLGA